MTSPFTNVRAVVGGPDRPRATGDVPVVIVSAAGSDVSATPSIRRSSSS